MRLNRKADASRLFSLLCGFLSATMTRRRGSASTPQPVKRAKVAEDGICSANGSADSRAKDAPKDHPEDDAMDEPKIELPSSSVSPSPAPRNSRPRRAAADRASAATAVIIAEDDATASVPSKDTIHEKLFAPITAAERKAWQGWSDIESEPVRPRLEDLR